MSFYDLDEFLEAGLIPRHPGVDVGDQSKCFFAGIVQRREVSEGCLHLFVVDQSGSRRNVGGTPTNVKGTVERSPTKSASSDFWPIEGNDGFLISTGPRVSCPILEARTVLDSRGRFSLKRESGISSSVRYHVCL